MACTPRARSPELGRCNHLLLALGYSGAFGIAKEARGMSSFRLFAVVTISLLLSASRYPAYAYDSPDVTTTYYMGESKMTLADGTLIRTSISLVKRVVNKKDSRIEEHVLSVDERESKAFVVTLEVKGAKFTVSEKSGAFNGEGELVGKSWEWTEWKSETKLADGAGTVTSEDKLTDRGMSVKKTFAGVDGKVALRFEEALDSISQKTYEILYARLAPTEGNR